MTKRVAVLLCLVNNILFISCAEWSYSGENGPNFWGMTYPACSQQRQSPINIDNELAVDDNRLPSFSFHGYDDTETLNNLTLSNDGYTVTVRVHGNLHIQDGGLSGEYSLEQFHIHWGSNDAVGSEHVVDGISYPLELHLVHKTRRHKKISKALADPTGLAVLGIFAKIGKHHPHLQEIIEGLETLGIDFCKPKSTARYIHNEHNVGIIVLGPGPGKWGESHNIRPFAMHKLLPQDTETFYRYQGSLTTPPCSESVVWTVFQDPIEMSETQMDRLRGLSMITNITDNYRPVQSLNGRWISVRKKSGETIDTTESASSTIIPSICMFMDRLRGLSMITNITDNYRPVQSLNGRWISVRKKSGETIDTTESASSTIIPSICLFVCALVSAFVR